MKFSHGTSNFLNREIKNLLFLKEISSFSHTIAFLLFLVLFTYKSFFLISPCCSLELCSQMGISFFSPCLLFIFISQLFVRPPQTTILPFCLSFSWGWFWLLPPVQCYEPLNIVLHALCLSDLSPCIYLSLSLNNHKGFDWMVYGRPTRSSRINTHTHTHTKCFSSSGTGMQK